MLEGKIGRQGFLDTIQLLSMSRKTGKLEISGQAEGNCFFFKGDLLDCRMGNLEGDQAFVELFILVEGSFKFTEEKVSTSRKIKKSLTDLLMQSSKQASLWDKAQKEIPYQESALLLAPTDPDRETEFTIDSLAWSIISRIDGSRSFAQIAEILGEPKTRVGISVAELKRKGLVSTEDEESAILRTVFRKITDCIWHIFENRIKPKVREKTFTEFNKWSFSQGFSIRLLEGKGVVNNVPYSLSLKEKQSLYRKVLAEMYEAALTGINRNELRDHLSDLYERLSKQERRAVAESGMGKFITPSRKGEEDAEFWETTGSMGADGILPR